jgi:hypothetical protein
MISLKRHAKRCPICRADVPAEYWHEVEAAERVRQKEMEKARLEYQEQQRKAEIAHQAEKRRTERKERRRIFRRRLLRLTVLGGAVAAAYTLYPRLVRSGAFTPARPSDPSASKSPSNSEARTASAITGVNGGDPSVGSYVEAAVFDLEHPDRAQEIRSDSRGHACVIEIWSGLIRQGDKEWWLGHRLIMTSDGRTPTSTTSAVPVRNPTLSWPGARGQFTVLVAHWPSDCTCKRAGLSAELTFRGG